MTCPAPLLPPWVPQCLAPPSRCNVTVVSHSQYVVTVTAAVLRPWWIKRPGDLDILTLKVVSWVTCDVGYPCANFGLLRPLCSRLRPDVRDRRQTNRRQTKASLNAPPIRGGHNNGSHLRTPVILFKFSVCCQNLRQKNSRTLNKWLYASHQVINYSNYKCQRLKMTIKMTKKAYESMMSEAQWYSSSTLVCHLQSCHKSGRLCPS